MTDTQFLVVTMSIVIVKAVQTCIACPEQWLFQDDKEQYYYARHRHGRGAVGAVPSSNDDDWEFPVSDLAYFKSDTCDLYKFLNEADMVLASDAEVNWYIHPEC